ncbi:hypothetical protein I7819_17695 [Burkholderia multivorans]|uniref:hypothetical protein n=1 Tax=Burkholderia multivorans TaxID=87883 RepID=UPI0019050DAB|nr:hypothetical protein [Burkholderia multivorans]MBJ9941711.1 hypothetical protein [Burkholderia multivorans]MBU9286878.1 hypothetical protein [Burkholderia multivorans]
MNKMKGLSFGCVFAATSTSWWASPVVPFAGEWDWRDSPSTMTFSIDIRQQDKRLQGQYCAVAQNRNKTDCDDQLNPNIDGIIDDGGKSAIVDFSSFLVQKTEELR